MVIIVGMAPPMDFSKFMPAGGSGFGMPGGGYEGFDDLDMGGGDFYLFKKSALLLTNY